MIWSGITRISERQQRGVSQLGKPDLKITPAWPLQAKCKGVAGCPVIKGNIMQRSKMAVVLILSFSLLGTGCVAVKIVDTAASAAIGVTKVATKVAVVGVSTAAKGVGAVAGAAADVVVPDDDKKKKNRPK